ncbi:cupin domain-containing protein [Asaia sp. VD9]|uniref:cupin domain-containing protein n=1 Tax=Asaia sp. VD9 TaxID=3081235 RepID=UPI003017CEA9
MASFDHRVIQRLFGLNGSMAEPSSEGRPGPFWATRFRDRARCRVRSPGAGTEGWAWSERVAPYGVPDVRVEHHHLGAGSDEGASRCKARGWGMVISGSARLEMAYGSLGDHRHDMLEAGDVWSVPADAEASFHAHGPSGASLIAFIGGRETQDNALGEPWGREDSYGHKGALRHGLLSQEAEQTGWGSIRVVEADVFSDPDALSAAFVEIMPDCRTDLHWHLNTAVWQICIEGTGLLTQLASGHRGEVTRLAPGMVCHVPRGEGYHLRNDGETTLTVLEIFRSDHYHDLSLPQWLAAASPEAIAAHLCVDVGTIARLSRAG